MLKKARGRSSAIKTEITVEEATCSLISSGPKLKAVIVVSTLCKALKKTLSAEYPHSEEQTHAAVSPCKRQQKGENPVAKQVLSIEEFFKER